MAGPPVSQNATPTGDTRYNITLDPGAVQIGPGQWRGSDGVLYQGDDPSMVLGDKPNVLDPNLTDWRGGGGGSSFSSGSDLYQMAVNSPFYQQALAATQAAQAADAAARKQAVQQALIQFGLVPANFTDTYGDIDATTRSLAEQNTTSGISIAARLKQALQDAQRESSRRLAARGLRRSGTRGYQMRRNQLGYDQNYSDAVNSLLGGINQTYSGFAQGEYGRNMSLAQALQSAIQSMSSWYTPSSGGGGSRAAAAPAPTYYNSVAGPSPYKPQSDGYYTGGALYATQSENKNINPVFWFK